MFWLCLNLLAEGTISLSQARREKGGGGEQRGCSRGAEGRDPGPAQAPFDVLSFVSFPDPRSRACRALRQGVLPELAWSQSSLCFLAPPLPPLPLSPPYSIFPKNVWTGRDPLAPLFYKWENWGLLRTDLSKVTIRSVGTKAKSSSVF